MWAASGEEDGMWHDRLRGFLRDAVVREGPWWWNGFVAGYSEADNSCDPWRNVDWSMPLCLLYLERVGLMMRRAVG